MWQNLWGGCFLIGVGTRGKAESRKKKVEIAKSSAMSISQLPPKKHLRYSLRFTPALLWEHKCSVVARLVQASTKQVYLLL